MQSKCKSMPYHLSFYHGHIQLWLFGIDDKELEKIHLACYPWCHKPERDRKKDGNIKTNRRSLLSVILPKCKTCRDRGYIEREVTIRQDDPRWSAMLFGAFGGTQYVVEKLLCPTACDASKESN